MYSRAAWFLLAFSLIHVSALRAEEVVGLITKLRGTPDSHFIERDGQKLRASIGKELVVGDTLFVKHPGYVVVSTMEGYIKVKATDSPYRVSATNETMGVAHGFWRRLTNALAGWSREIYINAVNRAVQPNESTKPLSVPLLETDNNFIVGGNRKIILRWFGGVAPFTVAVERMSGEVIAKKRRYQKRIYRSEIINLQPGRYRVSIFDNDGATLLRPFQVVSQSPVPPSDLVTENAQSNVKAYLKAAWLSTQDDGKWRWESYHRVDSRARQFPPARMLAYGLTRGRTP